MRLLFFDNFFATMPLTYLTPPQRSSTLPAMQKRSSTKGKPTKHDNDTPVVREKNPAAVALGRLGGLKGGKARAESLSAKKRTEIAKNAAQARWKRQPAV
jgi:hypothetical protein